MGDPGWYFRDRGQIRGPFARDQLVQMYRRGQLGRFHEISQDRVGWVKASTLLEPSSSTTIVSSGPELRTSAVARTLLTSTPFDSRESSGEAAPWPLTVDEAAIAGDRPRSKSSRRIRLFAILAIPCVLLAAGLTVVAFLSFLDSKNSIKLPSARTARSQTIQSSTDQAGTAEAVGFVVVGFEYEKPDGTHGEDWISSGSCFAITKDGYLLTNRHVVEFAARLRRIKKDEDRVIQYARHLIDRDPKIKADLKPQVAKKVAEKWDFSSFEPKIWVFFTKKTKLEAQIVHICDENEFDMAILKVDRSKGGHGSDAYFRLASEEQKVKMGNRVASLGFPAAERDTNSLQEKLEEANRKALGSKIETIFNENDFTLSYYEGLVSRVYQDGHCGWISHSATVSHGNSGGPLVSVEGLVVGINTLADPANGIFKAISVSQLRELVESKVVDGFVFSDR